MMDILSEAALQHIHALLYETEPPGLPQKLGVIPILVDLHTTLLEVRDVTKGLSEGDDSRKITSEGVIAGHLKALQAKEKELLLQAKKVKKAAFVQAVSTVEGFSESFNRMMELVSSTVRTLEAYEGRFRHMAYHDALTGVLSRTFFTADGERMLREAVAANEPFGLILVDIDRFKSVNDTHGHQAGDAVLQHIAALFGKALRDDDPVYRYGGEEFVTIFRGISLENARRIAERLRSTVESSPVSWEGSSLRVTASFGVCVTDPEPESKYSFGSLVKMVDDNMYAAKAAGRNRIVATLCSCPVHRRRKMDGEGNN